MRTLGEIESAVAQLPLAEQKALLRFLVARVNGDRQAQNFANLTDFVGTIRLPEDPLAWQQRVRGEWE